MLPVYCTTSDKYLHLIPVFCYLFNKYWGSDTKVEIAGYKVPDCELPANFSFHSMGVQGDVSEWSTDLRKYFSTKEDWFVFLMEDTLLKAPVIIPSILLKYDTGRIDLTKDVQKRPHSIIDGLVLADYDTKYRLSTQPSIWNKVFLLNYLKPGLTPWQFECLNPVNDGWNILGLVDYPVRHNEGVRKNNIYELDLNGLPAEDIAYLKNHNSWIK